MNYPGHDLTIEKRTPGEERLMDYFWPANCLGAPPEYFRESVELLKTVQHREAAVIARLTDVTNDGDDYYIDGFGNAIPGKRPFSQEARTARPRRIIGPMANLSGIMKQ